MTSGRRRRVLAAGNHGGIRNISQCSSDQPVSVPACTAASRRARRSVRPTPSPSASKMASSSSMRPSARAAAAAAGLPLWGSAVRNRRQNADLQFLHGKDQCGRAAGLCRRLYRRGAFRRPSARAFPEFFEEISHPAVRGYRALHVDSGRKVVRGHLDRQRMRHYWTASGTELVLRKCDTKIAPVG